MDPILACPNCKNGLSKDESDKTLICAQCDIGYPIENGIAILLADMAINLDKNDIYDFD